MRLSEVLPIVPRPSMQLQPSHQMDDIGAMFGDPSSFRVEIRATGVPKYRIVGSILLCTAGHSALMVIVGSSRAARRAGTRAAAIAAITSAAAARIRISGSAGPTPNSCDRRARDVT